MPRRNLFLIIAVGLVSAVCYFKAHRPQYSQTLGEVIELIERKSLDPPPPGQLFQGAMKGMLDQLDEHSTYIGPARLSRFEEEIDQEFTGVGMELGIEPKTKHLIVVSPLLGSPAYEAGIRAGDHIIRINGRPAADMTPTQAREFVRGKPGDPVVLAVLHQGQREPVELTLVRAVIHADTVRGDTRNPDGSWNFFLEGHPGIGYLRISTFGKDTNRSVAAALDSLTGHGLRGLILDLRDNPGGLLDEAWRVCDLFIDSGVIVTVRGHHNEIKKVYEATHKDPLPRFPMAVLVNQWSASASEIVAACLQDHRRAVIVGQRTYGKGTVQEMIELGESPAGEPLGAVKITTASYWRPSGRNIHHRHEPKHGEEDGVVGKPGKGKKNGKLEPAHEEDGDWGVSPDKGYQVVVEPEEWAKWAAWRQKRDTSPSKRPPPSAKDDTQPNAKTGPSKQPDDRPLAKAVEYIEKEAPPARK